jgi:pentatricopeptide repeat protein
VTRGELAGHEEDEIHVAQVSSLPQHAAAQVQGGRPPPRCWIYHVAMLRGFVPDAVSHYVRVVAYCKKGRFLDALQLLDKMCSSNDDGGDRVQRHRRGARVRIHCVNMAGALLLVGHRPRFGLTLLHLRW